VQRLGNGCGQVLGFERSERGVEDGIGAAEFAQQLSGGSCSETGSQREREPANVIVGMHREGNLAQRVRRR
jgi:hypothetical protein